MDDFLSLVSQLETQSALSIAIYAWLLTFPLGVGFTYLARAVARQLGVVAAPRADRWHQKPTAMLGGFGIYTAFMIGCWFWAPSVPSFYVILGVGSALFGIGLIDDLIYIKPYTKLVVQLLGAVAVVSSGLHMSWTYSPLLNNCLTIFWLVGMTNAINLLDNMDGLAGGISLIACVFLGLTFLLNGQPAEAVLPMLLAGAVLGFLVFNFSPASIFMGDCGSMFLGFVIGTFALLSDYAHARNLISVLLTPVLIMAIPIFDTCVVTVTRKLSGRPVSQGGRDHTSHRLVALGMSERRAVLYLYSFAMISGLVALFVRNLNLEVTLLLIPSFALVVLFLGFFLGKVRIMTSESSVLENESTVLKTLVGFAYKRRVFEVVMDAVAVALAYYGAFLLRYDGNPPADQMEILSATLLPVIAVEMVVLLLWGVYRGLWHYAGLYDLVLIAKAVLTGAIVSAFAVLFWYDFIGPSRAVLTLNPLLLLILLSAMRLSFRVFQLVLVGPVLPTPTSGYAPVLIYGAGDGGELLLRELLNNTEYHYAPFGFLDDDKQKVGKHIHGFRIFGRDDLPELMQSYGVNDVLVSSWQVPASKLDELSALGMELKRMRLSIE